MKKLLLISIFVWLLPNLIFAQEGGVSIGKGRVAAHSKAILELFSDSKGLLVPRMSSESRNAIFSSPDDTGKGLMVYDTDKKAFYYYNGTIWKQIGTGSNQIEIGASLPSIASSSTGELFFNTSASSLYIFDGGQWVESSAEVGLVDHLNSSSTTEALTANQGRLLKEAIEAAVANSSDDQNISDFSIDGSNVLSITLEDGNTKTVDLSAFLDNTDNQTIADFSIDGSNLLSITLEDGNTKTVDLSAYLDNTDDQALSLSGNILSLEDGGTVDLSSFLDNTDNQSITNFEINGSNELTITLENGNSKTVDLSAYLDNEFNSAAQTKLAGIEAGATADMTGAEIKAAYEAENNTNAFTDTEQAKLAGIESGAQANTVLSVASKTGHVSLIKDDVGLENVDNTSDADKPISTATQTALDLKADINDILKKDNTLAFTPDADYEPATKKYVDDQLASAGGDATNEGSLSVFAGSSTTSIISSNTSGSTDVTIEAGDNITLDESGNTITIAASGPKIYKSSDNHAWIKSFGNDLVTVVQSGNTTTVTVPSGVIVDYIKLSLNNTGDVYGGEYLVVFNFGASSDYFTGSTLADAESWLLPQIQLMDYTQIEIWGSVNSTFPGKYIVNDGNRPIPRFYDISDGSLSVKIPGLDSFKGPLALTFNW